MSVRFGLAGHSHVFFDCRGLSGIMDVGVQRHMVADGPSQQLVNRHTQRLTFDVPQRDVDTTDDRGDRTTTANPKVATVY